MSITDSQFPNNENNPDFHQDEFNQAKSLDKSGRLSPSDQTSKPAGKLSNDFKSSSRYLQPDSLLEDVQSRYK